MEGSMANTWLQDFRGVVGIKFGEAYYLEPSLRLQPSHNIDEYTLSSSSTLWSESGEQYSYFDPYMQTSNLVATSLEYPLASDCRSISEGGSLALADQVLDQLLTYKDMATWGMHQPGVSSTVGDHPLHQLPGWNHHDDMMEEWAQQNSSCTSLSKPVRGATETQLSHHGLWMNDMSPELTSCNSLPPSLEQIHAPFQSDLLHSSVPAHSPFDSKAQHELTSSPIQVGTVNKSSTSRANRKAAARKNRILLRQRAAPHQRGSNVADSLISPRALKRAHSTKIPREFLMRDYVQGHDMDPLRFLLHKVLQPSDVSNLGRIVISKKEAETHLPYLPMKEGIFITMEDFDTAEQWTFRYRFWPNSRSRMYLLESTGDFVKAHHLKEGDVLVLWRNSSRGTFVIRGMVAHPCWNANEGVEMKNHTREDDMKGKTIATG